jgi:hypothetical protein
MISSEKDVWPKQFKYAWSLALYTQETELNTVEQDFSDVHNTSTSHKALGRLFKQAGMNEGDCDVTWDFDKIQEQLWKAWSTLKVIHWQEREK